jgi:hypothetical protein
VREYEASKGLVSDHHVTQILGALGLVQVPRTPPPVLACLTPAPKLYKRFARKWQAYGRERKSIANHSIIATIQIVSDDKPVEPSVATSMIRSRVMQAPSGELNLFRDTRSPAQHER